VATIPTRAPTVASTGALPESPLIYHVRTYSYIAERKGERRRREKPADVANPRWTLACVGPSLPPKFKGRVSRNAETQIAVCFSVAGRRRRRRPPPLISRYATSFARSFKARRAARRCQFSGNYHRAYPRRDQRNSRVNNARGPRSGEGEGEGGGSRQNCAHGKGELSTGQRHRELART